MLICCLLVGTNAKVGSIGSNIVGHAGDFEGKESKELFHVHDHTPGDGEDAPTKTGGEISGGTLLDKEESHAAIFLQQDEPEEYMKIHLPREDGDDVTLLLYKTDIWAEGGHVIYTDENGDYEDVEADHNGLHYWGIVEGHEDDSLAMCSLQETEYSCLIQIGDHQLVLGNMADTGSEVLYDTADLQASPDVNYQD